MEPQSQTQNSEVINYHGFRVFQNQAKGYAPYFQNMLSYRLHKKMATNIIVTGEAGLGKSYLATDICRVMEGLDKHGKDRFSLDQVIFTYSDFMELVLRLPQGKPIVFDEPSYSMGKREWYKDLNKALVQTIESFRFRIHPLVIPIINKTLLDKIIREQLIQYQITLYDRGRATVYRLKPSQFRDQTYHEYFCKLEYSLSDMHLCARDSCLDCDKLPICNIFRARYERKKASVQEARYEQAKELAQRQETRVLTLTQLENLCLQIKDKFLKHGKIDVQSLRVAMYDTYGVKVSNAKGYELKSALEMHHGEELNISL